MHACTPRYRTVTSLSPSAKISNAYMLSTARLPALEGIRYEGMYVDGRNLSRASVYSLSWARSNFCTNRFKAVIRTSSCDMLIDTWYEDPSAPGKPVSSFVAVPRTFPLAATARTAAPFLYSWSEKVNHVALPICVVSWETNVVGG